MNKLFSIVFILLFCSLSLSKEYSYNDYVGISYVKIDASEVFSIGFQNRFKNDYSAGIGFVYYNTDGVFADSKTRIWLPYLSYDITLFNSKKITSSILLGANFLNKNFIFNSGVNTLVKHNSLFSAVSFNFKIKRNIGFGLQLGLSEECEYTYGIFGGSNVNKHDCGYMLLPSFSINIYDVIKMIRG